VAEAGDVTALEVRLVQPGELDAAGRATYDSYREFYAGDPERRWYLDHVGDVRGRAGRTDVLVVLLDGEVVGSATLELGAAIEPDGEPPPAGVAHLRMLGVDPRHRRRGAGEALLRGCLDHARRRGRRRLTLHTVPPMIDAQRLYDRLGFHRGEPVHMHGMDFIPYDIELTPGPQRRAPDG
jgi:ribosomal protein S18 acetylase RimI-like enzyme